MDDLRLTDDPGRADAPAWRCTHGRRALVVVARRPVTGAVKRRLAAAIGAERASSAYRDLLAGTLRSCEQVEGVSLTLALTPEDGQGSGPPPGTATGDGASGELVDEPCLGTRRANDGAGAPVAGGGPGALVAGRGPGARRWQTMPQRGDGLGARLAAVFADTFAAAASSVVILNSDSPALPPAYLRRAFELLGGESGGAGNGDEAGRPDGAAGLVLGPTIDGGFYLIGTDRGTWARSGAEICALLADTPMGTPTTFARTEQAALTRGLRVRVLPIWIDVDEPADLRVSERLTSRAATAAPRGEPLAALREVYLHVTHRCGRDCPQCYDRHAPDDGDEMTTQEWKAAIDQCVSLGAGSFVFIGGDPFLRRDLLELIDHVTGERLGKARLFFSGLIDPPLARALAAAGHGRLRPLVSVDGIKCVNDALRGSGNFRDVLASIDNLLAAGLQPVANTVALAPVLAGLPDLARTLRAAGVDRLHLIFPHPCGGLADSPDLMPSGAELLAAVLRLRVAAADIGLTIDNVAAWQRRVRSSNDFCAAGCRDLAIDPVGNVHACPITCGDPAFVAGDLRTETLESIWRDSPALRLLRHLHARDRASCASCAVVDACGGECWMQAHYAARVRGEPAGPAAPFPYCDLVRPVFEELSAGMPSGGARDACARGEAPVGVGGADYSLFDCI